MADDSHPTHLSPSELGTKEYWETFYARTLSHISTKHDPTTSTSTPPPRHTHTTASDSEKNSDEDTDEDADDDSDPGTSWFSEHNAPDKVLRFLTAEEFPLAPCNTLPFPATQATEDEDEASKGSRQQLQVKKQQQPRILDLGTGNGSMLALLRKRGGFRGAMVGVDYSAQSVELARQLQRLKIHSAYLSDSDDDGEDDFGGDSGLETEAQGAGQDQIRFEEWDILLHSEDDDLKALDWFPYDQGGFDIVLDKGTFDAVSLSDETVDGGVDAVSASGRKVVRRVCERYPGIARRLVRKGGFLIVTSCNWTEEELIQWFTFPSPSSSSSSGGAAGDGASADRLEVWGRVEYPRFRFGGQEGQGVCTVCFQRV